MKSESQGYTNFPLLASQESIYFDQLVSKNNPKYNVCGYVKFKGSLDIDLYLQAYDAICDKYSALNLIFSTTNGRPTQTLLTNKAKTPPISIDFTNENDPEHCALRWMQDRVDSALAVNEFPLYESFILCINEREFWLFDKYHHLIADVHACSIKAKSIIEGYLKLKSGEKELTSSTVYDGFVDEIERNDKYLISQQYQEDKAYWQDKFPNSPPALLTKKYLVHDEEKSRSYSLKVDKYLLKKIKHFNEERGVSVVTLTLAALSIYFNKVQDKDECVVGIPVHNRTTRKQKELFLNLVGTIPTKLKYLGEVNILDFVLSIREQQLRDLRHRRYPISHLKRELEFTGGVSSQLHDIVVNYVLHEDVLDLDDVQISSHQLSSRSESTPLHIKWQESKADGAMQFQVDYGCSYFSDSSVESMIKSLLNIIDQIYDKQMSSISSINLLDKLQYDFLAETLNKTEKKLTKNRYIHQLLEEHAALIPDKVAFRFNDETLTYKELNERSNQLARYLRKNGATKGALVGLSIDRSVDLIIGLFAILKAGCAYVPIEPDTPRDRILTLVENAKPSLILTKNDYCDLFNSSDANLIFFDKHNFSIKQEKINNLGWQCEIQPEQDLAYVIYTSGTTGVPKGVMNNHLSLLNLQQEINENILKPANAHNWGWNASFAFDSSVKAVMAMLSGICVTLLPKSERSVPEKLIRHINKYQIDILDSTPMQVDGFLGNEYFMSHIVSPLHLVVGGEKISSALWRQLIEYGEKFTNKVFNVYGPTECTVDATMVEVASSEVPTLGRPISNVEIYILSSEQQLLPFGEVGEICISGIGLSSGYLFQPELSKEKFIDNKFSKSYSTLYRTGDLGRYLPNGNIEYIGRNDNQIKLRGYRIELAEIEAAITQFSGIQQSVVEVMKSDEVRGHYLAAYFTRINSEKFDIGSLKQFIESRLPSYMVPTAWVELTSFKLTVNGKVDRKSLPMADINPLKNSDFEAPKNEREKSLCNIWEEILDVRPISRNDNFFSLGGHSLLATQLLSRLEKAGGWSLEISDIFETKDLKSLASKMRKSTELVPPIIKQGNISSDLSFAQQRLWFLDQLEDNKKVYNISGAIKLKGKLNTEALGKALNTIIERHEILRTSFISTDDGVVQQVQVVSPFLLRHEVLSSSKKLERLKELELQLVEHTFDLSSGPLICGNLICCGPDEHVLMIVMHHIISDGWSMGIMIKELSSLYTSYVGNETNPLAELPIQYSDYSAWQRKWLSESNLTEQLDYWCEQLEGAPTYLSLPSDYPRPVMRSFNGDNIKVSIDEKLSQSINQFADELGATPFIVLLTGWMVLLSKLSQQKDIIVGAPVANRKVNDIENLIGFFSNTIALRHQFDDQNSIEKTIDAVKTLCLSAYNNQDTPFEQVIEAVNPERNTSFSPLFQTMFAFHNSPEESFEFPMLQVEDYDIETTTAKFDLTLSLSYKEGQFVGELEYSTDILLRNTVSRWLDYFLTILKQIIAEPSKAINEVYIVNEHEEQFLLNDLNRNEVQGIDEDICAHQLFELQERATPSEIAVVDGDTKISFQSLNNEANQLANYLREQGVKQGTIVGLNTKRSIEMIVGVLAILKAGGAYLPLLSHLPKKRLDYIIASSGMTHLLTDSKLNADLNNIRQIDLTNKCWQDHSKENLLLEGQACTDLAYVLYTSGTTGLPKGVKQQHRTLSNLVQSLIEQGEIDKRARTLQFASMAFDVFIQEVMVSFYTGSTLYLLPEDSAQDLPYIADFIIQNELERIFIPPAVLYWLVEYSQQESLDFSMLRTVVSAGEALTYTNGLRDFLFKNSQCELWNHYGPTETHVVTTHKVDINQELGGVSIGKPIANVRCLILDEQRRMVPYGVKGDLYFSGPCVASGYISEDELNNRRFIANPFTQNQEFNLYNTGDIGRFLPDGTIEYLGRNDDQISLRGFRIELSEVEAQLTSHEAITNAVVLLTEQALENKHLVAYCVFRNEKPPIKELRDYLKSYLPDYMIPSAFILMENFPLTNNGKVDRTVLPIPKEVANQYEDYQPVEGAVEKTLASIWKKLLNIEIVGRNDNFFELGGHSLLATRMLVEIKKQLSAEISLKMIFIHPVLWELAEQLSSNQGELSDMKMGKLVKPELIPLSFSQQRLWFIDRLEGGSAHYNMPLALKLVGEFDAEAFKKAINSIVSRHEILRTTYHLSELQAIQKVSLESDVNINTIDLCYLPKEQREITASKFIKEEAEQPFDLSKDLMIRAKLVKLDDLQHIVIITLHHIASDGWSISLMIREFNKLYNSFQQGIDVTLPGLEWQYSDYALWQRKWLSEEHLNNGLQYWREQLAALPLVHSLPLDVARPTEQTFKGASYQMSIDKKIVNKLLAKCLNSKSTLFMGLHALFAALLSRYSGEDDIVIGTPVANRENEVTQEMIGFFVNTLALRSNLNDDICFDVLLEQSKSIILDGLSNQHVPFDLLVDDLNPPRDTAYSPLVQVMLVLDSASDNDFELTGLVTEKLHQPSVYSKYDIMLNASQTEAGLELVWSYNSGIFNQETVKQMASHFESLLTVILEHPTTPIKHLEFLSQTEKEHLIRGLNPQYSLEQSENDIVRLFTQQVSAEPNRIALVHAQSSYTYRQLDERSSQLANLLINEGVQPEQVVGVLMERSPMMIISLLAILKVGAAYCPIGSDLAESRIEYINSDCNLALILTQTEIITKCQFINVKSIAIDTQVMDEELNLYPTSLASKRQGKLAYVMYTSGTTGKPKGVNVKHQGIARLVKEANYVELNRDTVMLQAAAPSFDAATFEIWGALLNGGKLILYPHKYMDFPLLVECVNQHCVNTMWLTAGLFDQFAEKLNKFLSTLKNLLVGGDVVSPSSVHKAFKAAPYINLINGYGPTENTTFTCCYNIPENHPVERNVPIGKPISGSTVFLLDKHRKLVPYGCVGELYTGGDGVADGYRNDEKLLNSSFIRDPFSVDARSTLYKTGDHCRYIEGGVLEYIGRSDKQLKVRGFRVDLHEVEETIIAHDFISAVVVMAEEHNSQKMLIAYIKLSQKGDLQEFIKNLKFSLRKQLPEYMCPDSFFIVDSIPLNNNGKVDYRKLKGAGYNISTTTPSVALETEVEKNLAEIWVKLLKVERVSKFDNFFDLGGNSLIGMSLCSAIFEYLSVEISIKSIFESPILCDLAALIEIELAMNEITSNEIGELEEEQELTI